jgi:[acyl-carrier-protein] S-malonyltransferase
MAAVIGTDPAALFPRFDQAGGTGVVANANVPRQTVISGDAEAVAAVKRAVADGALGSAVSLSAGGAFHSPLMQEAQEELADVVARLPLRSGHTPMISSMTGDFVTNPEAYRKSLVTQITAPVRWADVTRLLLQQPLDGLVEVGPGSVLSGLVRRVERRQAVQRCGIAAELLALEVGEGAECPQP